MINFKKVRFKNITSFGNQWTEIQLDRSPSTIVIGQNGSGKSSAILDTIALALFGRPFRKIKKEKLVSVKNAKDCLVEIEFFKKDKHYMVRRGLKPNIFEIYEDGKMLNQNAAVKEQQAFLETQILNMNFDSACQIILIGKAQHTMFMNMSAAERRKFVECVLNLTVFSNMSKLHSTKVSELKAKLVELKSAVTVSSEKIKIRKQYIEDLENADRDASELRKNALKEQMSQCLSEHVALSEKSDLLKNNEPEFDKDEYRESRKELDSVNSIKFKLIGRRSALADSKPSDNQTCSLCGHELDKTKIEEHLAIHEEKLAKLDKAIEEIELKSSAINSKVEELQNSEELWREWSDQISTTARMIKELDTRISSIEKELNSSVPDHSEKIKNEKSDLKKLVKINQQLDEKLSEMYTKQELMTMIGSMLKDSGIKSALIKRFIPMINHEVNQYLAKLGLFATFTLDENFDEKIRSRGFDDLSYNSFSEGEKLRIDLALLMAWRSIAKLQGNVSSNLMVLDEIFDSSLDIGGADAMMDLLNLTSDLNIFIVTHTPEKIQDKVRSVLKFEKVDGFSKIAA